MTTVDQPAGAEPPPPVPTWRRWGVAVGYLPAAVLVVFAVTVVRVVVLFAADYNLGPDEAQYWSWSQEPAFGYFSKPPMIAWLIGLTTGFLGDGEAAIRVAAPLLHMATALVVLVLARDLYDDRIAFWSALVYATAPAVWFSSGLITTDVPLLLFWALALLALHRTLTTPGAAGLAWACGLGLAVGLGLMSKYAMLYFLLGAGLFLVVSREDRAVLARGTGAIGLAGRGVVAVAVVAVVVAPNILWNLGNGLSTVEHTAANANWGANLFNPGKLLEFVGAQFGVFGPLLFAALLWGLVTARRRLRARADLYLVCFVAPSLAIVTIQAFVSRANANWAVTAYVAAAILVVVWLARARRGWWLVPASVGLHTALAIVLCALILSPALVEALGRSNDFKRVRGWETIGAEVQAVAAAGHDGAPFTAVLTDDRLVHAELLYYARPHARPMLIWDGNGRPDNHFELRTPFTPSRAGHVLLVSRYAEPTGILRHFRQVRPLGTVEVPTGGARTRTLRLYALQGYRP